MVMLLLTAIHCMTPERCLNECIWKHSYPFIVYTFYYSKPSELENMPTGVNLESADLSPT
jgi:hypothetical protein